MSSTVFKNAANIIVVFGEWIFYEKRPTLLIVASLLFILFGAFAATLNVFSDHTSLDQHAVETDAGVFWAFLNCACSATFVLYLRFAAESDDANRFDASLYNNALAPLLLIVPILMSGEARSVPNDALFVANWRFLCTLIASGVVGVGLSFCSFWCISMNDAATYTTGKRERTLPNNI